MSETSRQEWETWVELWRESGKPAATWCRENALPYWKFNYWRKRLASIASTRESQTASPFALVSAPDAEERAGVVLEIGGVRLNVFRGFDPEVLASVIGVLSRGA